METVYKGMQSSYFRTMGQIEGKLNFKEEIKSKNEQDIDSKPELKNLELVLKIKADFNVNPDKKEIFDPYEDPQQKENDNSVKRIMILRNMKLRTNRLKKQEEDDESSKKKLLAVNIFKKSVQNKMSLLKNDEKDLNTQL